MKKIIFSILAFAGILASCSNDDIEVNTYGDIVYAVSTQSVYEEFEVLEDLKTKLLSKDYNIGIYTFIYDEAGDLVASDSLYTTTFGRIEQNFNYLPCGHYTAITLEMMVNKNENNTSESWVIVGQDNMSTLEILNKTYIAYWYSAVGLSTQTITVSKGQNQVYEIKPKGIGAIINTYFENFDYSNYVRASFHTKDQPVGRYLSPVYSGDDRFHYEKYNEERVWDERGYVYYEKIPNDIGRGIYLLEEGIIKCCFGAYKPNTTGGYINSFYAFPHNNYKYTVEDGRLYYGMFCYVGGAEGYDCEATLDDNFEDIYKWFSSLKFNFVQEAEPYLNWGASASAVATYMNNSGMKLVGDGYNDDNTSYFTYWTNYSNTLGYEYIFEPSKTNLKSLLMIYSKQNYKKTDVMNKLKSKFIYDGYDESFGGELLYSADFSTMILVMEDDEYILVMYVGASPLSAPKRTKSSILPIIKDAKSSFKSIKK